MIHQHEQDRILGTVERQGADAAMAFIRITYRTYRTALMRSRKRGCQAPHHATLPDYRRSFIESCVTFRHYIYKGSLT